MNMSSQPQHQNVQSGEKISTPRKQGRLYRKSGTKHMPLTGKNCRASWAEQQNKGRGSQSTQIEDMQVSLGHDGPIQSWVIPNGSPVA